jgi:hypothetical protein
VQHEAGQKSCDASDRRGGDQRLELPHEQRRRAEVAEAEVTRRTEGAAQAAAHAPSATGAFVEAQEDTVGLWGRLARLLGR